MTVTQPAVVRRSGRYFWAARLLTHLRSASRARRSLLTSAGAALIVGGCQTFSADGGLGPTQAIVRGELGKETVKISSEADAAAARARVAALLQKPLTADSAVQVALLNNRGLQAAYNALGISEAEFVAASLPPNPAFSFSRLGGNLELEIERRVVANLLALLTLPARKEIAEGLFRQAQLRAAQETLTVVGEARRSYYRAVAAGQVVGYLQQAQLSAEAASDLTKKLGETGAASKLDQAREHAFHAEVAAQLGQARQRQKAERERLTRVLGLWGSDVAFRLPAALPALPRRPWTLQAAEADAVRKRVDLQIARLELETLAKAYGLTNATRFVNVLELAGLSSYERTKSVRETAGGSEPEKDKTFRRGFEIGFEIPIFDGGETRVRDAQERYMQAVNRLAEKAVNIRSEAREAYQLYRGAYDLAAHYRDQVLPLRKTISDESQLRYNAMIIDVFELLADARARIASTVTAIEAQRDFWIADTDLRSALIGGGGGGGGAGEAPRSAGAAAE
ncbi:TolC family protein [Chelatococcus sp. SYSU_G07232]|uniref:TolC family protein n=1 Tax=Chelatococcus albus TaxID=3047466 RepID=A0ABT7AG03_9HYPH|nr:TolC family protein [Chelatococcus sp. SYSU_G07232]MDJ1157779.1 TolC family protein [Chelatococcus sp. SYSU_G07232]